MAILPSCIRCGSAPKMVSVISAGDDMHRHHWMMQCSRCGNMRTPLAESRNEAVSLWTVMCM